MSLKLEVLRFPDSRLRNKAKQVQSIEKHHVEVAQSMLKLMYEENGVGLSSIQVNQPIRVFVADTRPTPHSRYGKEQGELEKKVSQPLICFNPKITYREGKTTFKEGCLSFPSYFVEVERSEIIEMTALNERGEVFTVKADGLLSICIQHEIDHLDGKLFIDHLSPIKAEQLRNKIKKYGYPPLTQEKIS